VKHIHWLLQGAWPGKDAVFKSDLATIRLRSGPSAANLPAGSAMTFGDHAPEHARLLLVGKYHPNDPSRHRRWMDAIRYNRARGGKVWVDYTDNHLGADTDKSRFYREAMQAADGVICPTPVLQSELKKYWSGPTEIIEDANDLPILPPKTALSSPRSLMWFGDASNLPYLFGALGIFPRAIPLRLFILTRQAALGWISENAVKAPGNVQIQFCPWSIGNMIHTAGLADACVIPSDPADPRKNGASSNRLISALALGLPVAADMLDSYREFAACFVDLRSARFHDLVADPLKYREMVLRAQAGIVPGFSIDAIGGKWGRMLHRALEDIA
jgi:hypothetical protein